MSLRFGLAALSITLAACGTTRPAVLHGPSQPLTAEDYPAVMKTWTRSAKVYKGLENKLFVSATFHAPELRRAFAIAFPEIYGHGGDITRRELVDLTGDIEQYNNLFVAVYTPNPKWNDLAKSDSIWRLTLIGSDEVAVGPAEIVPIKIDENLRAVYPYIGRFDKGYVVRFPQTDPMNRVVLDHESTGFKLRIASALGVAEMEWVLVVPQGVASADDGDPGPGQPES
ncbi:MAG: hypothetical protein V3T05_12780 [Myxococcota bacterium]